MQFWVLLVWCDLFRETKKNATTASEKKLNENVSASIGILSFFTLSRWAYLVLRAQSWISFLMMQDFIYLFCFVFSLFVKYSPNLFFVKSKWNEFDFFFAEVECNVRVSIVAHNKISDNICSRSFLFSQFFSFVLGCCVLYSGVTWTLQNRLMYSCRTRMCRLQRNAMERQWKLKKRR